jgi:hypothetical protein
MFLLAGWFLTCLLCQASPATAQAHHGGSSEVERGCATVAEASPVSAGHLLVESLRNAEQSPVLVASSSPFAFWGWGRQSALLAVQREIPSPPSSPKLYQLNRVYRI